MSKYFSSIHHSSLIISELERSIFFYGTVLGLEIDPNRPKMSGEGVWFIVNDQQQIHLLLSNNDPYSNVKRPVHKGLDRHLALKTPVFAEIKARIKRYEIPYTMSKSGRNALFCCDPDNNVVEIME